MQIYNTMTRRTETLRPLRTGKIGMYTCGPTVYDYAHIGNFRAYVWEDLLRRSLKFLGFDVTQVMNITDIEDKIIKRMAAEELTLEQATEPYIEAFFEDLDRLGIERAEHYPRASEHIPEMLELAVRLRERGLTYTSQGSLYYRIEAFDGYGRLSNLENRQIMSGARVDSDEYDKEDARDFVLWKAHRPGEPSWDGPFGAGRPGWHLECSAMGMKYLGETFDLHTGGVDNIFPHHENEIAQSEGATGKPFVNYWMHAAHLMVDGHKMAKSKGNFYTLRDVLEKGHEPRAVRLLLLSTHYRSPLNFTFAAMAQATSEIQRLDDLASRIEREPASSGRNELFESRVRDVEEQFAAAIADDLNISSALGALFQIVREAHVAMDKQELPADSRSGLKRLLNRFDGVLGIMGRESAAPDERIVELIEKRSQARAAKNFEEADGIRNELLEMGIVLEDTPQGTIWKRKLS